MAITEYGTPINFFNYLNCEFHFTLDVCASVENYKCRYYFTKEINGLEQNWIRGHPVCWMNPPYDKSIGLWVKKAYDTAQGGGLVVALIQGRSTDTKMWHDYVMKASEIRFIKDRLHFSFNGKSAMANISSVIVVFRPYCKGPPKISSIDTNGRFLINAV